LDKIISFGLRHKDYKLLGSMLEGDAGIDFVAIKSLQDFSAFDFSNITTCFLFVDESIDTLTFESMLKRVNGKKLNVILKYKDFDYLMLCYKYKAFSVFEGCLNKEDLDDLLLKMNLMSAEKSESIPTQEILNLFSIPSKLKSNIELYIRLKQYFKAFCDIDYFSIIEKENEKINFLGEPIDGLKKGMLSHLIVPDKYIGTEAEVTIKGKVYCFSPVYKTPEQETWLVIASSKHNYSIALNKLFYKYLENILIYRKNKTKETNFELLASTDDVTGLFNQRKLSHDLEQAVEIHQKQHENFSIMFIDIDHFKSVNDNYGHVIGSKLLQDIGEVLSLILRASDHIYRYGGDEFVVIMPSVDMGTVHEIASRVLNKIKNKSFDIGNGEVYRLTVSIGIAEYPTDAKSAVEIIKFADEMMYMSKRSGRGKVFHIREVNHVDAGSK
jgi:diguanylate cyclase (GGDEF)-like protein